MQLNVKHVMTESVKLQKINFHTNWLIFVKVTIETNLGAQFYALQFTAATAQSRNI